MQINMQHRNRIKRYEELIVCVLSPSRSVCHIDNLFFIFSLNNYTKCSYSIQQFQIILFWIEWYCNTVNGSWILYVNIHFRSWLLNIYMCAYEMETQLSNYIGRNAVSRSRSLVFVVTASNKSWRSHINGSDFYNKLDFNWEVPLIVILLSGAHFTYMYSLYVIILYELGCPKYSFFSVQNVADIWRIG